MTHNTRIFVFLTLLLTFGLTPIAHSENLLGSYPGQYADCSKPLNQKIIVNKNKVVDGSVLVPAIYNQSIGFLARSNSLIAYRTVICPQLSNQDYVGVYNSATGTTVKFPGVSDFVAQATFLNDTTLLTAEFNAQGVSGRTSLYSNDLATGHKNLVLTLPETDPSQISPGTTANVGGMWAAQSDLYLLITNENCKFTLDSKCSIQGKIDKQSKWTILRMPISAISLSSATVVSTGDGQVDQIENFVANPSGNLFAFHATRFDSDWGDTFYEVNASGRVLLKIQESGPVLAHQYFVGSSSMFLIRWNATTHTGSTALVKIPTGKSQKWGVSNPLNVFNQVW